MATYSVSQLIGKTIVAKKDLPIYRLPSDSAQPVYVAKAGQTVGVVDSYVLPKEGRSYLHLSFLDEKGKPYYIRWGDAINTAALNQQGVKSDETIQKEQDAANKPFDLASFIQKNITLVIITIAVISLGGTAIKTYGGRK